MGASMEGEEGERMCNCKKSNCLKKYCECFNSGVRCNSSCKCEECRNREECKNGEEWKNREDLAGGEGEEAQREVLEKSQREVLEIDAKLEELAKMVSKEHHPYVLAFLDYLLA